MAIGNGKLNFAIALNMTTNQFKKGADIVKKSLRGIQYQVLGMASALGFGTIGLSNLAREFINVSRETNRARVALSNISEGAAGFKKNMDFLTGLAGQYGQELNGVTSSFAKFSAASNAVGMGLQDQYRIYEGMTKAITAFGLTSSEAQLTYMALGQMMSKGKVTAEELRRQMGERIPIAMEAMARAAGVSMQELDNLMKRGEVYSAEVLPKFADELNKMLGDINVDNIETSLNRLRNSFITLTEDLGVGALYKKIIDGLNGLLGNIQQTFTRFAATLASAILTGRIASAIQKFNAGVISQEARLLASMERAERQKELAAKKRIDAVKAYEEASKVFEAADLDQRAAMYAEYQRAKTNMDKARNREKAAINNAGVAQEELTAFKTTAIWAKAGMKIKAVFTGVWASIKSMAATFIPMAIIGAIVNLIFKARELRNEAERIRNIVKDNNSAIMGVADPAEIEKLRSLSRIIQERLGSEEEISSAQKELNRLLGVEEGKQIDINAKVNERIRLLKEAARADVASQRNAEMEQRNREIMKGATKNGDVIAARQYYEAYEKGMADLAQYGKVPHKEETKLRAKLATKYGASFKQSDLEELSNNLKAIQNNNQIIDNAVRVSTSAGTTAAAQGAAGGKETPLQKAEKRYSEGLVKLANQKAAGAIKTEEYNEALDALNKATYEEIAGILGDKANRNKTFQLAKKGVEAPLSYLSELGALNREYNGSLKELNEKKRLGLLSEDKYNEALLELIRSTVDKVAGFEKIGKAEEEYIANLKNVARGLVVAPEKGTRDTTFDYKKSKADKLSEEYRLQEEYVQALERDINKLGVQGAEAIKLIDQEQQKLTSLSESLKLAELREDIEAISKDIFSASVSGVVGFANALDSVANSWERIADEKFDDLSTFEQIVAVLNAIGDTIGGIVRMWETYAEMKELIALKEGAQAAEQTILTGQKIANDAAEATSAAAKSAAVVTGLEAEKAAATGLMAAKSTAAYAGMPFVGAGLAAKQIAAMQTLIAGASALGSGLPAFAEGGIVGGNTRTGDRQIIRANSGEMILTTAQQSNLFKAIKNDRLGGGGGSTDVKFTIKGKDLEGVISNNNALRNRR